MWWPRNLSKESYLDQFLVVKIGKIFETFWWASIHSWRKVVCYLIILWCGLEAYRIGVTDKLILENMGESLKSICMEGHGHMFTFDLILFGSMCNAEGFWVQ